jgi:ribosomal protein L16 Arg81 hydroxylase
VLRRVFLTLPKVPTKDELLTLSMDDDVESRILESDGGSKSWSKEYGPFEKKYLRKFFNWSEGGEKGEGGAWTVLVQEVDRHIPTVADMWNAFDFIPSWRRDDIMISFATPGGGIGAHVDNYDVFLVQGRGTREWSIENSFLSSEEERQREVPNIDTRLLRDFRADQSWTLQPGDVLYLPPRVPHRGTALGGGCTTVSLGFRAPSYRSMLTALTSYVCEQRLHEGLLYSDPDLAEQQQQQQQSALSSISSASSSAEVSSAAVERIRATLRSEVLATLDDDDGFRAWLGTYLTEPLRMQVRGPAPFFLARLPKEKKVKEDEEDEEEEEELPLSVTSPVHSVASKRVFSSPQDVIAAAVDGQVGLRRAEGVRLVQLGSSIFINGERFPLPEASSGSSLLVQALGASERLISGATLAKALRDCRPAERFLASLLRSGWLYPVDS